MASLAPPAPPNRMDHAAERAHTLVERMFAEMPVDPNESYCEPMTHDTHDTRRSGSLASWSDAEDELLMSHGVALPSTAAQRQESRRQHAEHMAGPICEYDCVGRALCFACLVPLDLARVCCCRHRTHPTWGQSVRASVLTWNLDREILFLLFDLN